MTPSAVIRLAQEGDAQAITLLINQQLQPRGITAKTSVEGECLHILLEGAQTPPQRPLVTYLSDALTRLSARSIQLAHIYGRQQGQDALAWSETLPLGEGSPVWEDLALENVLAFEPADGALPRLSPAPDSGSAPGPRANPSRRSPKNSTVLGRCFRLWAYWQFASLGVSFVLVFLLAVESLVFAAIAPDTFFTSLPDLSWKTLLLGNLPGFSRELALVLLVSCFFLGLILGDAQTEVLQQRLRRVGGWKWATAVGVPLGLMAAIALRFYGYHGVVVLMGLLPFSVDASVFFGLIMPALAGGLGFWVLGLLQWLTLSRKVPRAYRWPLSTLVSGVFCGLLGGAAGKIFTDLIVRALALGDFPNLQVAIGLLLSSFIAWLSFHAITGVTMARLIHRTPKIKMRLRQLGLHQVPVALSQSHPHPPLEQG